MPTLSCLCCSACFLDAVGPRGWRDGCGAQVARCVGTGIACRCCGKAVRRWQHLRAMRDFGFPDAKKGPLAARFARHASRIARLRPEMDAWGEDVAILISKSMHFGRKLPGRGPFSRIRRKRDACGAILASQGPGADAMREGDAGGGARWARWGAARGRAGEQVPAVRERRTQTATLGRGMAGVLGTGGARTGSR